MRIDDKTAPELGCVITESRSSVRDSVLLRDSGCADDVLAPSVSKQNARSWHSLARFEGIANSHQSGFSRHAREARLANTT